jgi:uncharacterized protein
MDLVFEWDETKANSNEAKHGVSFHEAITVFSDINALTIYDVTHSDDEERYITMGFSQRLRILLVVYTEYEPVIRIISARKATSREQKHYEQSTR